MMKWKYSLHPKEFDLGGTERYYSDMARKGWKLVRRGPVCSRFVKSEPAVMQYRIEVVSPELLVDGKLPENQIGVYEDCGWEYVTGNGFHHVFRAPVGRETPEFYLEPEQQAQTLKALQKRYIWNFLSPLFYVLFFVFLSSLTWNVTDGHWFAAFYKSLIADTDLFIGGLLLLVGLAFDNIWGTIALGRLYHKMKKESLPSHEFTGKHYLLRFGQWAALILGVVWVCMDIFGAQTLPMPEKTEEPYILLNEIGVSGKRTENFVRSSEESKVVHKKSLLAESWAGREFLKEQQWLYQEVYILKEPKMMNQFVEALMYNSTFAQSPENFTKVDIAGLDQAWVTEKLECIAVRNNTVAILTHSWDSSEDMMESLQKISQKWNAMD